MSQASDATSLMSLPEKENDVAVPEVSNVPVALRLLILMSPPVLGACLVPGVPKNPCERYVDAVDACYEEALADTGPVAEPLEALVSCPEDYESVSAAEDAFYQCASAAYEGGDCGSAEGAAIIAEQVGICSFAGTE